MSDFALFLEGLLSGQNLILENRPVPRRREQEEALAVLEDAYAPYATEVSGPAIPFQPHIALHSAVLVWRACWLIVAPEEIPRYHTYLRLERGPRSPSDHLSADLLLRFLPEVYRGARGTLETLPLAERMAQVLRQWPLSGVRARLPQPPITDLKFAGHWGLQLLYAERLAQAQQANWLPQGPGLQHVKKVFQERGLALPVTASLQNGAAPGSG